jgi:hypothetical protein
MRWIASATKPSKNGPPDGAGMVRGGCPATASYPAPMKHCAALPPTGVYAFRRSGAFDLTHIRESCHGRRRPLRLRRCARAHGDRHAHRPLELRQGQRTARRVAPPKPTTTNMPLRPTFPGWHPFSTERSNQPSTAAPAAPAVSAAQILSDLMRGGPQVAHVTPAPAEWRVPSSR